MLVTRSRGLFVLSLVLFAGCVAETSYPLIEPPPADAGLHLDAGSGGSAPSDAGSCTLPAKVCSPVPDAGPDATCPPAGTVTGSITSQEGTCTTELISVGGPVTADGCCSTGCCK